MRILTFSKISFLTLMSFVISFLPFSLVHKTATERAWASLRPVSVSSELVYITVPREGARLSLGPEQKINISGSAYLKQGFQEYQVYYVSKKDPAQIKKILEQPATGMIRDSSLCFWDPTGLKPGEYLLMLRVKAVKGKQNLEFFALKNITLQ